MSCALGCVDGNGKLINLNERELDSVSKVTDLSTEMRLATAKCEAVMLSSAFFFA